MIRCGLYLVIFTLVLFASCRNKRIEDESVVPKANKVHQDFVDSVISNHIKYPQDNLIPDRETAVDVAEPVLFKAFGKDQILNERPYHCRLIKGYWAIEGSLPKGMHGGVFEVIISANDGQIIQLSHSR